jgi:predicted signal transduction protein with EAL and GGDEF domain
VLAVGTLSAAAVKLALGHREGSGIAAETRRLALTDDLTGLGNRRMLRAHLRSATQSSSPFSLLLIDLDRFKEINDSLGHSASQTAFAVDHDAWPEPRGVAEQLLASLAAPMQAGGMSVHVEASIGIAHNSPGSRETDRLLQRADVAMYEAKSTRNRIAIYSSVRDPNSVDRLQTIQDLRRGLTKGEIVCYYQPQIDLRTGSVTGVEALARWEHPVKGTLGPDAFLPLAERTGLIGSLTAAVLRTALQQCRQWRDAGRDLRMSVNLSPTNLHDETLPELVNSLLVELGLVVVAEGIETRYESEWLTRHSCDFGQGFAFARPLQPQLLERWMHELQKPHHVPSRRLPPLIALERL